ncbi:MAG: alpha/beta fold hydrolase [Roseofilum sp. SBFL]|uniref:alpha/beta fold hydrolase n=1 Tax=unclassified Roseofilum TaxID=2620099 RepID=UPI001B2CF18C|nr:MULTISPECIES: alpha/beta fold hydrolase [unclassified Roseofilum]MBP0014639.1 alpha/beta fold hydrolase [Roseofilum sp. SID3]MBP0024758.1 alpha/beta fold hydrolase [Roseofilum sp. SID2]MBP0036488.1 alpha/beta fold hydrolase [Roseofilum sp. SID1]MBP0042169.1 alpha/beta fold hydrolase [Roseofilum sp. SBFL]
MKHASLSETQYYTWKTYRCAYEVSSSPQSDPQTTPLLLLHPIGVGLSRRFWDRFITQWRTQGYSQPIYNPDLLGCGESDMPHVAYTPEDWAEQLNHFIETVIQKPVILVVQGGLFPVAIALTQRQNSYLWLKGLVLSGPPAWPVITQTSPDWQNRLLWNGFDSPLGRAFYRYARRRQFLESFSIRQLFGEAYQVDDEWLDTLQVGAQNPASRHAVFSFLAGFWRRDYQEAIRKISQPTLVVVGEKASSISKEGKQEKADQWLTKYLAHLPNGEGKKISGRNVLPYESTETFVSLVAQQLSQWEL